LYACRIVGYGEVSTALCAWFCVTYVEHLPLKCHTVTVSMSLRHLNCSVRKIQGLFVFVNAPSTFFVSRGCCFVEGHVLFLEIIGIGLGSVHELSYGVWRRGPEGELVFTISVDPRSVCEHHYSV